mgnify:FL=1
MKLNRKGFMMAEVVVVSVIICTVLVTLYTSLVRINNAYDTRNRYYDIDTLYFTEEVNDMLIYMGYINEYISTNDSKEVNLNNVFSNDSNFYSAYNIDTASGGGIKMYFSLYDANSVGLLAGMNSNTTFKDYISYLKEHFDYNEKYEYMLITEICKTGDDCYYYGLRVR